MSTSSRRVRGKTTTVAHKVANMFILQKEKMEGNAVRDPGFRGLNPKVRAVAWQTPAEAP
jgi:hypothetical protein